jgi:nucleoside-diphosphate-sugar epimerase
MKVLVTGHLGKIGVRVAESLRRCDHAVVGFDLADSGDLLDLAAVTRAAAGCAAIVHLGGLAHDTAGTPEQIMAVNVLGTWHVLLAAEAAGVTRVIHFSSVQALGIAEGERLPDYFPVDDRHPRRATRPYGLSKRLAEDLCEAFTARTAISTISLRPVAVWEPGTYAQVKAQRRVNPQSEWLPFWEYGAFVDIRDVAAAVNRALEIVPSGHHRALLCASEISASAPSLELAERLAASVPVRDPERYRTDPSRALFDCSAAEALLGWQPRSRCAADEDG